MDGTDFFGFHGFFDYGKGEKFTKTRSWAFMIGQAQEPFPMFFLSECCFSISFPGWAGWKDIQDVL